MAREKENLHSGDQNWYHLRDREEAIKKSYKYGTQERREALAELANEVARDYQGEDAKWFINHNCTG